VKESPTGTSRKKKKGIGKKKAIGGGQRGREIPRLCKRSELEVHSYPKGGGGLRMSNAIMSTY